MLNLLPRDTVFYDLFETLAQSVCSCAEHLHVLVCGFPASNLQVEEIREEERHADEVAHQALDRLDRTFMTPFDREDIHTLIGQLDDIIDNVNALARRLGRYHVKSMDPDFIKQTEILSAAAAALALAVASLRKSLKLSDIQGPIGEVHRLENIGDSNHLAAVARLLDGSNDPLEVIKWREFYQILEQAIDGCEDAANVVERIVLKSA